MVNLRWASVNLLRKLRSPTEGSRRFNIYKIRGEIVRIVLMGRQALRQPQLSERRAGASATNIRNNAQLQYCYVIKVHRINFSLMNRAWRAEVVLLADYLLVGQPFVT